MERFGPRLAKPQYRIGIVGTHGPTVRPVERVPSEGTHLDAGGHIQSSSNPPRPAGHRDQPGNVLERAMRLAVAEVEGQTLRTDDNMSSGEMLRRMGLAHAPSLPGIAGETPALISAGNHLILALLAPHSDAPPVAPPQPLHGRTGAGRAAPPVPYVGNEPKRGAAGSGNANPCDWEKTYSLTVSLLLHFEFYIEHEYEYDVRSFGSSGESGDVSQETIIYDLALNAARALQSKWNETIHNGWVSYSLWGDVHDAMQNEAHSAMVYVCTVPCPQMTVQLLTWDYSHSQWKVTKFQNPSPGGPPSGEWMLRWDDTRGWILYRKVRKYVQVTAAMHFRVTFNVFCDPS